MLQVSRSGGFVPMGYDFSAVPELTVYADGRAIVPGPQILIYPGPLLPNLQVVQLSEADVGALVDAARDADLLGAAPDYGLPNVTDLPTTYVTLTVDGRSYLHAAYALGFVEGEGTTQDDGLPAGGSGLTDEQAAARISLTELIDAANALVAARGSSTPYAIEAFGVLAQPIDLAVEGAASPDAQVMPWPLDATLADLADTAECTVIDGAAARTLLGALGSARQATLFEQDDDTYSVWFRPLLPHEDGCEDLGVGG
ncbi:hypothetical protein [Cellulomonas sp. KRMCY2]|uniref:hypothetical protein n=1 Tax=Cellulomonas sp. KRMCY2 TaxID=1304865 RepID=UPI0004BB7105|nr:hypothetical protein [Cellulomonas sp. KRMCY2]